MDHLRVEPTSWPITPKRSTRILNVTAPFTVFWESEHSFFAFEHVTIPVGRR